MSNLVIDCIQAVGVSSATGVTIELTDQRGDPITGFVTATDEVIVGSSTVTTDANGQVTVDLLPNDEITPGNSCYTVRILGKSFLIQKTGITQNLLDALVVDPGELDPIEAGELADHINDPTGAHPASAISVVPFGTIGSINVQDALEEIMDEVSTTAADTSFVPAGDIVATNVQAAIEEVDAELHAHEADATAAHAASAVSVTPTGDLASTTVQAALVELQGDIDAAEAAATADAAALAAHLADTVDAHDASAISFVPTGSVAATDVQSAIAEVATDADAKFVEIAGDTMTGDLRAPHIGIGIAPTATALTLPTGTTAAQGILFDGDVTLYRSAADTLKTDDKFVSTFTATDANAFDSITSTTGNATVDSATAFTIIGNINAGYKSGTGNWANGVITGMRADARNQSSGSVGTVRAVEIFHGGQTSHGAITTSEGFSVSAPLGTGTITTTKGFTLNNQGRTGVTNAIGVQIAAQSGASSTNVGIRLGAATTYTLWCGSETDSTTAAGGITFGSSADTNLYRSAANTLKTDDSFTSVFTSADPASAIKGINSTLTSTYAASSAVANTSGNFDHTVTVASGQTLSGTPAGVSFTALATGAGNISGTFRGLLAAVGNSGGGTVTTANVIDAIAPTGSGNITNANGVVIGNMGRSGVANAAGLTVNAQSGASSNNWGMLLGTGTQSTLWLGFNANGTTAASGIIFGNSQDTNLYRSAADTLKTDDSFICAINSAVGGSPLSNVGLNFGGTVTGAATVSGCYFGNQTLSPGNGSFAFSQFAGGSAIATGASNVIPKAVAYNAAAFTKTGTGSISIAYGAYLEANTVATSNIGMAIDTCNAASLHLAANTDPTTAPGGIFFGASYDTNLYRGAANLLKTDDKLVTVAGLGVGNSAAATTPGSVVKKIEVFDAAGASLGFIPVYSTIT